MRSVGHELVLGAEELLELRHGLVEDDRERADLRRAGILRSPRGELALPHRSGGALQPPERSHDERRQPDADQGRGREHDARDRREHEPVAPNPRIDGRGRIRDAQRAVHSAAAGDGTAT